MLSEPPQQSCSQAMTQRRNCIYWTGECFHPGEPVWVYNHYSFISKNPAPWASLSKDLNGSKLARCCNIERLWGKKFTFICFFKFCPDSSAQWPSLCVLILIYIIVETLKIVLSNTAVPARAKYFFSQPNIKRYTWNKSYLVCTHQNPYFHNAILTNFSSLESTV